MNKVHLFGNLGKDPELKFTAGGNAIATLTLATSYRAKTDDGYEDKTEWHRLVCFGKRAEVLGEHCSKGSKLCVLGRLSTRKWQDKEGVDRYTTEVVVEDFDFGGSKSDSPPARNNPPHKQQTGGEDGGGFRKAPPVEAYDEDDIPF